VRESVKEPWRNTKIIKTDRRKEEEKKKKEELEKREASAQDMASVTGASVEKCIQIFWCPLSAPFCV